MDLIENTDKISNLINSINDREIIVNEQVINESCIVSNKNIIKQLTLASIKELNSSHIDSLLLSKPELVLIGSGPEHQFPDTNLLDPIARNNIGFEVMNNRSATRTYNILVAEERKVACLLII